MTGITNFFVKIIIQCVVWTAILSLPAGDGVNVFTKCQKVIFNNPVADAIKEVIPDLPSLKPPE